MSGRAAAKACVAAASRAAGLVCLLASLPGCASQTLQSPRPRLDVASCIAEGWRKATASGREPPVSLTNHADHCFVGVELRYYFSPVPTGTRHPTHAVWVEVRDAGAGSTTTYHRAYQFTHERIDRVVAECQGAAP